MSKFQFIKSKVTWILSMVVLTLTFSILAWLVYDRAFIIIAPLTIAASLGLLTASLVMDYKKEKKFIDTLKSFEVQWDNSIFMERLLKDAPAIQYEIVLEVILDILKKEKLQGEKLMAANDNYSSYIESWVHEIKTPLALLQLMLYNHGDKIPEDLLKRMTSVERTMENQIQQVLYYSRTQNCQKDFRLQETSLSEICREAVKTHGDALFEKGFKIGVDFKDNRVLTDRKSFSFILGQIIQNSIKYMDKDHGGILQFNSFLKDGSIVLTVEDNGPGVPAEEIPFIFDKGFTGTRGRENGKSTGMGLHIVSCLCRELDIKVQAQCNKNSGLIITFTFPEV